MFHVHVLDVNQGLESCRDLLSLCQFFTTFVLNCKQFPQQVKIKFVAESATLFIFLLSCCFEFHKQTAKALYCSKTPKKTNLRNLQHHLWYPEQFVDSTNKEYIIGLVKLSCCGISKLYAESAN